MEIMDTYDEVFAVYLKLELENISPLFRFTKKKGVIFLWIIGALAFIEFVLLAFLTDSVKTQVITITSRTGGEYSSIPIATYSTTVCVLLIIVGLLIVFFAGWLIIGNAFEKRAFRIATNKANRDWSLKKMKENEDWQLQKMHRDI